MKNILLPTDFSDTSINAIEYAVQLFKEVSCKFYILNTYEPVALYTAADYGPDFSLTMGVEEIFRKKSEEKVKLIMESMKAKYPSTYHDYSGISSFNMLNAEIEELVENLAIDAIVMGTKGASGLKEIFIGSQTLNTIKNAKVPVIGVPENYTYHNPKDVLFTTDYKTDSTQVGLDLLKTICVKHTSRLIFLNVYQGEHLSHVQSKNIDDLDSYFKNSAHLTQIAEGMEVLDAMEDFQSRHAIDLIVLVHNKHNFFENLLLKPVIQKTVHHASVPFLILPPYNND